MNNWFKMAQIIQRYEKILDQEIEEAVDFEVGEKPLFDFKLLSKTN